MAVKCIGLAGLLFGHNYQGRYSAGQPTVTKLQHVIDGRDASRIINASKPSTYHGDTCTRCGHTISTKEATP
jgi:hypothetical protein